MMLEICRPPSPSYEIARIRAEDLDPSRLQLPHAHDADHLRHLVTAKRWSPDGHHGGVTMDDIQ